MALRIRRSGASDWRLADATSGMDVGAIRYVHAGDGHHYRMALIVDGTLQDFGQPLEQLAMAAREIEREMLRLSPAAG